MRSTTRRRLTMCAHCSSTTPAPCHKSEASLGWLTSEIFGVGGKASFRAQLRASMVARKRQIAAADDPGIAFLSSELQPLVLAAGDNRYQVGK